MGFFGSLGRALTAPIRATNKVVSKAPGMGGIMGAVGQLPGMGGPKPGMAGMKSQMPVAQGAGIGPSPAVAPQPPMQMPQLPADQGGDMMGGAVGPPNPFQTIGQGISGAFGQGAPMSKARMMASKKQPTGY